MITNEQIQALQRAAVDMGNSLKQLMDGVYNDLPPEKQQEINDKIKDLDKEAAGLTNKINSIK